MDCAALFLPKVTFWQGFLGPVEAAAKLFSKTISEKREDHNIRKRNKKKKHEPQLREKVAQGSSCRSRDWSWNGNGRSGLLGNVFLWLTVAWGLKTGLPYTLRRAENPVFVGLRGDIHDRILKSSGRHRKLVFCIVVRLGPGNRELPRVLDRDDTILPALIVVRKVGNAVEVASRLSHKEASAVL